ncbi:hypothetical protein ANO11243_052980 [Dothideomycetidae sp. 11243]|nr:hypothetical protein ANO11243_052980 [fungal sp. No.11243]
MPDEQGQGFTDLERELTCSICTDVLYQPLTLLDCLHTFCGSCLREWFAWQATNATTRSPYTCPSCRAPVRGTRPNATVTTLLEVLLKASPEKGKPQEEKQKIAQTYKPGDNVIPPVQVESDSDSEDQRMLEQARELSLRDSQSQSNRRRADRSPRNARHRTEGSHVAHTAVSHRHTELSRLHHRPIEHQSSLRSLLSASDIDGSDMEEEIMRQIIDEGLLEGVDLSSMTPAQEEEITERIAQAFRRRQRERSPRLSDHRRTSRSPQSSANTRHRHGDQRTRSHSQSSHRRHDRPPLSRPHLLGVATAPEGPRHSRSSSQSSQHSNLSASHAELPATRVAASAHPASRSATDLSSTSSSEVLDRPRRTTRQSRISTDEQPTQTRIPRPRANTDEIVSITSAPRSVVAPQEDRHDRQIAGGGRTSSDGRLTTTSTFSSPRHIRRTSTSDPTTAPPNITTSNALAARRRNTTSMEQTPPPRVTCSQCQISDIQQDLHYNCSKCDSGNFNLCLQCYRSGKGCRHWFGFGYAASVRFQRVEHPASAESPHVLSARRYLITDTPQNITGTSNGNSASLEEGLFCEGCFKFANSCYWHCDVCNEGAWGFCQPCVQRGKHCTHPLEAMTEKALLSRPGSRGQSQDSPGHANKTQPSQLRQELPHVRNPESYAPLLLPCDCDICHRAIPPTASRFHCPTCADGDYDICSSCYATLSAAGDISPSKGATGWRRCPKGHRMTVVAFQERDRDRALLRVVLRDMVGGWALKESPPQPTTQGPEHVSAFRWRWRETDGSAAAAPVAHTSNQTAASPGGVSGGPAAVTPPPSVYLNAQTGVLAPAQPAFPPDGGVGLRVRALWGYFPAPNGQADDELTFPRAAEITEAEDINGDWFWGVYAGKKGLFPGNYGRVVGR